MSSMSMEMCLTLARTLGAQSKPFIIHCHFSESSVSSDPSLFAAMTDTLMKVLTALPPLSLSENGVSSGILDSESRSDVLSNTLNSIQTFALETLSSDSVTGLHIQFSCF